MNGFPGFVWRAPVTTHVAHAFYANCRKMYEYFVYAKSTNPKYDDFRAREFTKTDIDYSPIFQTWNKDMNEHMNKQLMHGGGEAIYRITL